MFCDCALGWYAHHSKHTACRRNQERLLTGEGAPTNPLSLKQSKMAVESGSEWRLCRMLAQILQNGKRLLTTRLELATSRLLNGCSTNRAPPAARCSKPHSYLLYMRIVCTVSGDLTCCAIAARYMLGGECFAGAKCSTNYKPDIITIAWTGNHINIEHFCPFFRVHSCLDTSQLIGLTKLLHYSGAFYTNRIFAANWMLAQILD